MNFLEKDLETIIYDNYEACAGRGLEIDQQFYKWGKRYRQLQLAPYGIADLVNIHYSPGQDLYLVQVMELKKGKIDSSAYLQAKRYGWAIFEVLDRLRKNEGLSYKIGLSYVLVGNELELSGDFVYALNTDIDCSVYTYSYGFDGIKFENAGRNWGISKAHQSPPLVDLEDSLSAHHTNNYYGYQDAFAAHIQENGDYTKPLLVTPEGILFNPSLLENGAE